jgi:phosphoribosyl 1,2-cyclic phosphodiesterase
MNSPHQHNLCESGSHARQEAQLCVIASSSSGNCSVLTLTTGQSVRTILIDAGLSPRRTRDFLTANNLPEPSDIILTHLDCDHWHAGWLTSISPTTTVHIHKRHLGRAERCGLACLPTRVFRETFEPAPGVQVHPLLVAHDDLGTAAFVFEFSGCGRRLGYATDTGVPTPALCDHLKECDVLAIESNYCPTLLAASNRPDFLKQRISGGRGHLSNQQSSRAVAAIAPRERLILLHLSAECNSKDAALSAHTPHAPGGCVTIADKNAPTAWMRIVSSEHYITSEGAGPAPRLQRWPSLFDGM